MFSIGKDFNISIFGASHENSIGIMIQGIKAGFVIDIGNIKSALLKRRPQNNEETKRIEKDEFEIISGIEDGHTTESPLVILIKNTDINKDDYSEIENFFRPGHADYSKFKKYHNFSYKSGGGIFSGRMTAPIVIAGEVARQIYDFNITSEILFAEKNTGSKIRVTANNVESGLGEPFFDSVESCISHLIFSIPSVKGINFGNILENFNKTSEEVIDEFYVDNGVVKTRKNYDGGIQGGITNGMPITFDVFLKPIPTVAVPVKTINKDGNNIVLNSKGRHDKQIAGRVRIVLESVLAITLLDLKMRAK